MYVDKSSPTLPLLYAVICISNNAHASATIFFTMMCMLSSNVISHVTVIETTIT